MAHISLQHVEFQYPIYQAAGRSIKVSIMQQMAGGTIDSSYDSVTVRAINNLNLEIEDGARVGLIGRNGSGKSSLLRVLAGVAHPQAGVVNIEGRVIPLIERALGVNPELSGMANIELPMRFLGATTAEIREAKATIPEFTGLGDFIHMPVRTYSEGMKARLAFALCTAVHGDILVLDEWMGAGDIDFHRRAQARLTDMVNATRILVLASHSLDLIQSVCNKAIWMDRGNLIMYGDAVEVCMAYYNTMNSVPPPEKLAAE